MNTLAPNPFERQPISSAASVRPRQDIHKQNIMETIAQFASVATILRISGALTVMAAMSMFLLQGWSATDDIRRFYLMISQTMLLAGGGFALSFGFKENKGARVFFGLGLLSIIAGTFTLGALILSVSHGAGIASYYPVFARWQAPSTQAVMIATGVGLLALAPIAQFSFMVLARKNATIFAALFMFTNILALIPMRESAAAGLIAMLGVLVPLYALRLLLPRDITLRTPEGFFAIATLFIPALIIIIRSLCFYQVDALLQILLAATGFAFIRFATPAFVKNLAFMGVTGTVSLALAGMIAYLFADLLSAGSIHPFYTLFSIIFTLLGVDVAMRDETHKKAFGALTAYALAASQCLLFMQTGDMLSAALFTLAGIAIFIFGMHLTQRTLRIMGTTMVIAGITCQLGHLVHSIHLSSWAVLAVLGITTIVTASILERYGAVIKFRSQQLIKLIIGEHQESV